MELFGFGFSGSEMAVLLLVALLVIGPKHLVEATRTLAKLIAAAKAWSTRLRQASAPDLAQTGLGSVAWQAYDPRQLDPRRMIREAVREEMEAWMADLSPTRPPDTPAPSPASDESTSPPPPNNPPTT